MAYREITYRSWEEFRSLETPHFDRLDEAIEGLMDASFLDEVCRYNREEDANLFDNYD